MKPRVMRNRTVRKAFGPKTKKVTEEWRKLHKWKLHGLHSLPEVSVLLT